MGCAASAKNKERPLGSIKRRSTGPIMVNLEYHQDFINKTNVRPKKNLSLEDNYKVHKTLGSGAYSVVKLGSCKLDSTKNIAVKSLHKSIKNQDLINCILHELHVLSRLDHPNIIYYNECYETNDTIDAVLEYSPGIPLDVALKNMESGFSFGKVSIMYQIAKTVAYLKNMNVVHRDLKPANIMVWTDVENLKLHHSIQLLDFGFAKDDVKDKNICGSPKYMAPEAILKESSYSSDVWSLGVIFYYIISGSFPYTGDDTHELFESIELDTFDF